MSVEGVQNGEARFAGVESEKRGQVESMKPENTSQTSQTSQTSNYSQTHCAGQVSKMRVTCVQNGVVVVPSVSDGKVRNASRRARALQQNSGAERLSKMRLRGVQNEGERCPEWVARVSGMAKLLKSATS